MKFHTLITFGLLLVFSATYCLFSLVDRQNSNLFIPPEGTVSLRISKETTIVTEPLLPDGKTIDFYTVLDNICSANAASNENGFRDIVQCLGREIFRDISDENWKILCVKLNIKADQPPQFSYLPLEEYLCNHYEKEESLTPQFDAAGKRTYSESAKKQSRIIISSLDKLEEIPPHDLELVNLWVKEMEPAISAVSDALEMPLYIVPSVGKLDLPEKLTGMLLAQQVNLNWPNTLLGVYSQRELIYMFQNRFRIKAFQNDLNAWKEVLSMFRIARRFGKQPYPDAQNMVNSFEDIASHSAIEFLKIENLDSAKLLQCKIDLDLLPERVKYENTLEYSQFGWLKNISEFPQMGPAVFRHLLLESDSTLLSEDNKKIIQQINIETEKTIRIYRKVPFDWNIVSEIMNAEFDERLGGSAKQRLFQSNPILRKIYDETNVRQYSPDELLAIIKDRDLKVHQDESWDMDRLKKLNIEERSVYLGKAVFAQYASIPELFSEQIKQSVDAFGEVKNAVNDARIKKTEVEK